MVGAYKASITLSHDGRGNMVTRGALALVYDEANQPVSAAGAASGTYLYDGHLKRVRQTFGGATTYSVYSLRTGAISVLDNTATGEAMALLSLGPVSVCWRGDGSAEYVHLDHLGSSVAASNAAGVVTWRESYLPFGEGRLSPAANDNRPGFTGHVDDAATGLTYMQARYFDPVLGRFLQTDPIGYADQLNLYAYVANDPVNNIDPTGRDAVVLTTNPFFFNWRHQAILIGDDRDGWMFTSREGFGQFRAELGGQIHQGGANTIGASFPTLAAAMMSSLLDGYTLNYRHAASPQQDRAMRDRIEAVIEHDYDLVFCNCGDLVRTALLAGGIDFPSSINPDDTLGFMSRSEEWEFVSRAEVSQQSVPERRRNQSSSGGLGGGSNNQSSCPSAGALGPNVTCGSGLGGVWH